MLNIRLSNTAVNWDKKRGRGSHHALLQIKRGFKGFFTQGLIGVFLSIPFILTFLF